MLCALCHYTQGTCASAVCIFCRYNGCRCLPVRILHCLLLILCAFTIHFAYYHTMYHFSTHLVCCYPLLSVMLHGHPHDAWPLSCCVAIGLLPCLCRAARRPTCSFGCISPLASVVLYHPASIMVLPCHSHAALMIPYM